MFTQLPEEKRDLIKPLFQKKQPKKRTIKMNLQDCYIEEDLFPKIFTKYEERDYGILFYNTENKDSFDSNHAVIYRERIQNLQGRTRGDGI